MRAISVWIPAAAVTAMAACGGSYTNLPASPTGAGATLHLRITDSPFTDAQALLVTFSEVTAHRTGGGFAALPFAEGGTSRTCDLKKLVEAEDLLGTGPLAAGRYTQVRLVVSGAALYFDNPSEGTDACAPAIQPPAGRSEVVEIPSGEVRLVRPFEVPESGATTMLIDFDGDRSVRMTGNGRYLMTPVITVVSVQ